MKKDLKSRVAILAYLVCSFAAYAQEPISVQTPQQKSAAPKLIVGIVVDQMRFDYIDKYWKKFGDGGFRRLVQEGNNCKNTNYNYVPTYTGPGHASIYTGTTPSGHGIVGNNWYVRKNGKYIYCTDDTSAHGVGGADVHGRMSPKNLLAPTFGEMLRNMDKQTKVIGIALKDRGAILPAGHNANAAYWNDPETGNWMTSTYYMKTIPKWVSDFNKLGLAKTYTSKVWNTMLPITDYTESTPDNNSYEGKYTGETAPVFPHDIPKLMPGNGGLGIIRNTPWGNTLTKDFAIETIKGENLGKGTSTDMLTVSFSSTDYVGHMYGPQSIEVEDTYLRLDKDLEEFLKFIDLWLGKDKVLIFLTADHGAVETPAYLIDQKKDGGYIDPVKIADTLRKVLFKKYGDSLVKAYINQEVYLDKNKINEKKWNVADVTNSINDLLMGITGISGTVDCRTLNEKNNTEGIGMFVKNGVYVERSGDIYVNYKPGWVEHERTGTTHGSCYDYDTHVPLIWYGWKVAPGNIMDPVVTPDIVATLCKLMEIDAMKTCTGKPIPLPKK